MSKFVNHKKNIMSVPLIYKAFLSQPSETANPVLNIVYNTLGDIVWTRESAGQYDGRLNGAFTANKTICHPFMGITGNLVTIPFSLNAPNDSSYSININSEDTITLFCVNDQFNYADLSILVGNENGVLIHIEVYQ